MNDVLSKDFAESSESSICEPCISRNEKLSICTSEPHLINERKSNDLGRDLDMPKVKAELLALRLKTIKFASKWCHCLWFPYMSTVFGPVF